MIEKPWLCQRPATTFRYLYRILDRFNQGATRRFKGEMSLVRRAPLVVSTGLTNPMNVYYLTVSLKPNL